MSTLTLRRFVSALALVVAVTTAAPVQATVLVAVANTNWTTATTWQASNATSNNISTSTNTTALTTSDVSSSNFTPGAITVDRFLVRVGSRASGAATNTMTIHLANASNSIDVFSCTINVSDLPVSDTTADQGGWVMCKNNAGGVTLTAATPYFIRAKLSATTTAVNLCRDAAAGNWQRIVVTTTTGAPAAGDDLHIGAMFTNSANPAVRSTRTVTMDQTVATDYGSNAVTGYRSGSGLNISDGGTLTWGTTASTAYILQLSGNVIVYTGGTYTQVTTLRTTTQTLQLDCAADLDFGVINKGTMTLTGLSRISGSNSPWVLLSADAAAGASTINTAAQLSAANGDTVIITADHGNTPLEDSRTMNGDASASSFAVTATLTNAHSGTAPSTTEAFVLERNVVIKAVTDGLVGYFRSDTTGATSIDWVRFHAFGTNASATAAVSVSTTTGSFTMTNSIQDLADGIGYSNVTTATGTITVTNNVTYNCQSTTNGSMFVLNTGPIQVIQHCIIAHTRGSAWGITVGGLVAGSTLSDIRISGITDISSTWSGDYSSSTGVVVDTVVVRGQGNGWGFTGAITNMTITTPTIWRTSDGFVVGASLSNLVVDGGQVAGTGTGNNACFRVDNVGPHWNVTLKNMRLAGAVGANADYAVRFNAAATTFLGFYLQNVTLGGTAPYANFIAGGINNGGTANQHIVGFANLASIAGGATGLSNLAEGSYFSVNTTTATDSIIYTKNGNLSYDASVVDTSPSLRMTPSSATVRLDSAGMQPGHGFMVPVDSGNAVTASVLVEESAAYNGHAPRLIVKANTAVGITADTVLATWSGSTGSFVQVSGTTSAVTANGVLEFVVDCDGTAGFVNTDSWSAAPGPGVNPMGLDYFYLALPFLPYSPTITPIGQGLIR